jgi:hypothetical protein
MTNDTAKADEMPRGPTLEELPTAGLQVEEPLDVESIELTTRSRGQPGSFGWESSQAGSEPVGLFAAGDFDLDAVAASAEPPAPSPREQQLERENLDLAAELAGLRAAGAERERLLEARLAELAARTEALENELTDQSAQIASLILERDGLRARLATASSAAPLRSDGDGVREDRQVERLKRRLEERGRALAVVRQELESARTEHSRLAEELAERTRQVSRLVDEMDRRRSRNRFDGDFRNALRRLVAAARRRPAGAGAPAEATPVRDIPSVAASHADTVVIDPPPVPAPVPPPDPLLPPDGPRTETTRRFLISLEPDSGEAHELTGRRVYVGRAPESGIRITDTRVSRVHAVLRLEGDKVVVEDAASTNGVFVNGTRVRRAELNDFDTVAFGSAAYLFRLGPSREEAALHAH